MKDLCSELLKIHYTNFCLWRINFMFEFH